MKPSFTRSQMTTILHGILCVVVFLVVLQLWLLSAGTNAYLGGDGSVLWPAAFASVACCGLNLGLLRYLRRLEQGSVS